MKRLFHIFTAAAIFGFITGGVFSAEDEDGPLPPGTVREELVAGGFKRTYLLHRPAAIGGAGKVALVIFLHGGSGNAAQLYEKRTQLSGKADRANFIVAYPDSASKPEKMGWNSQVNTPGADTAFIRELIAHLTATQPVDPQRVYLCGFSTGALLTHRLAAELSDQIAAAGVVSGSFFWTLRNGPVESTVAPTPARAVPIVILHGAQDKNVPLEGANNERVIGWPVAKSVDFWVKADGCDATPATKTHAGGNLVTATYGGGRDGSEVVFHTIQNGGHAWPLGGDAGINANDALWDFFLRHPAAKR